MLVAVSFQHHFQRIGVFPKCFHRIQRIQWQKYLSSKELKLATSCVRDQDVAARHIWETGSLNWAQFMLQWFIRFPEFAEFSESSVPRRNNSVFQMVLYKQSIYLTRCSSTFIIALWKTITSKIWIKNEKKKKQKISWVIHFYFSVEMYIF